MNQTHLHLLINHLPVIGSLLGSLVLVHGLWTRSNPTKIAAGYIFVLSSIGALVAWLTGEAAEETAEGIPGIAENMIEQHESSAQITFIAFIILGVVSLVSIFLTLRKSGLTRSAAMITLLVSLVSFVLAARTGYLGGQIRHTEIGGSSAPVAPGPEGEMEDDD